MKTLVRLVAATMLIGSLAVAAEAKTLVYMLGRQPGELQPADQHHRHQLRRRPVRSSTAGRVRARHHQRRCRASPSPGNVSDDGLTYTFHLQHGREVPFAQGFHADARLQRR